MPSDANSPQTQTFVIVWSGQLVSTIGSYITHFAITLWAWQLTGKVTAFTLIVFSSHAASLLVAPFAGVIVDRWNRRQLMMLSDAIAALSLGAILLLYCTNHLQVWHFYITGASTIFLVIFKNWHIQPRSP